MVKDCCLSCAMSRDLVKIYHNNGRIDEYYDGDWVCLLDKSAARQMIGISAFDKVCNHFTPVTEVEDDTE